MSNNAIKLDLDLSTLLDPEIIIVAAETEDDIGCILRLHLQVEQLLEFYLAETRTGEITDFIKLPRDFGGKLSIAVALGLPLEFARVAKQVNAIRNRLAHDHKATISPNAVKLLGQTVNAVSALIPELHPVERRYIELLQKKPDNRYYYGEGNYRLDFILAVMAFLEAAVPWLIQRFAQRHIVVEST